MVVATDIKTRLSGELSAADSLVSNLPRLVKRPASTTLANQLLCSLHVRRDASFRRFFDTSYLLVCRFDTAYPCPACCESCFANQKRSSCTSFIAAASYGAPRTPEASFLNSAKVHEADSQVPPMVVDHHRSRSPRQHYVWSEKALSIVRATRMPKKDGAF